MSKEARRRLMSGVRTRDTQPEMIVRRILHGAGFRYRLHRKDLPGRPDVVLPKYDVVIQVHGCFWHGHECAKGRRPRTNRKFWETKVCENRARDTRTEAALEDRGWRVVVVWECETRHPDELQERLLGELRSEER